MKERKFTDTEIRIAYENRCYADMIIAIEKDIKLAKKEIFDDKLIIELKRSLAKFKEGSREYAKRKFAILIIEDLKKRHLSEKKY